MRSGGARLPIRFQIALMVLGPLLAWGAARWLDTADVRVGGDPVDATVQRAFAGLLDEAREAAAASADPTAGARVPERWSRRLEGHGTLGAGGRFERWTGSPATPPEGFPPPDTPAWTVRVDGVRTRLFVAPGQDSGGRTTVSSFIIDTTLDDLRFRDLLPKKVAPTVARIEFLDAPSLDPGAPFSAPPGSILLRSPDDAPLALATPARQRGGTYRTVDRRRPAVIALLVFLLLAAFIVDWRAIASNWPGALAVLAVVVSARWLLVATAAPARLLPVDWGGPSVYGSLYPWGLLVSPVDLLLTGTAVAALCLTLRVACSASARRGRRPTALLVSTSAAVAATACALALAVSIARDSGLPPADRPVPFVSDPRLAMWLGLLAVCLGAGELWALVSSLVRPGWRPRRRGAGVLPVALASIPLIAAAAFTVQQVSSRIAVERAATEIGPRLLDQTTRRVVAVRAALQEIRERFEETGRLGGDPTLGQALAYQYWVGGELFHSGYFSSLAFFDVEGRTIDEFGYGLPSIDEGPTQPLIEAQRPIIRREVLTSSDVPQAVLHGEIALSRGDETIGVAIAHVIDEPDNLPFLPDNRRFLAALGPVFGEAADDSLAARLEYVLYGPFGEVLLTTLRRPPEQTPELLRRADTNIPVAVGVGDARYRGLAMLQNESMHLMLLPVPTLTERLAGGARAVLMGLFLLTVFAVLGRIVWHGGPRQVAGLLLRSFYARILIAFLLASVPPLIALAFFVGGSIERRADDGLADSAARIVDAARRVVEDYTSVDVPIEDGVLEWLSGIVGQEIHTYENGLLEATSMRELFSSGFLPGRLNGTVQRRVIHEGLPSIVVPMRIGRETVPVAYARARGGVLPGRGRIVAVPLVLEQQESRRAVARVLEIILLGTMALGGLLALAAAAIARTVANPVRDLVNATGRIAAGDYATRLEPRTRDEVAELVQGFNSMAAALGRQRSDLERRREYIETLLRHATTGVISLDPHGAVVTMNPAATALLAPCSEHLTSGAAFGPALLGCDALSPLAAALERAGQRPGEPVDVDLADDQQARRYRMARVLLERPGGDSYGTLVLLDDVTDLMRSNRLAAWAEMARAIAHEIKNPLTPIQLSAEHLRRLLRDRGVLPSPEEDACLETIIKQVRALHDIAGEFSAYAKLPELEPQSTDPSEFMRETIGPYRTAPPRHVQIRERYEPAPPISIDTRVLSRAVVNLIENALHAMADGGVLEAGVRRLDGTEDEGLVELYVRDSGPGLAPEVRRRLFEPYFSTKSSGTGLGLAIVRRAVEDHRGRVEVDSAPGRGTTFRIVLPAVDGTG